MEEDLVTTSVDSTVVLGVANDYRNSRQEIEQIMSTGRQHAVSLVDKSSNEATQALVQVIDMWLAETKRTMLDGMDDLATIIVSETDKQIQLDQETRKGLENILPENISSFLGG
jgi:hypothetical protein